MDDESGESMELMEEVPLKELGEAELERLVRQCISRPNTTRLVALFCPRKLSDQSDDDREISLLFQRLSIFIQLYSCIRQFCEKGGREARTILALFFFVEHSVFFISIEWSKDIKNNNIGAYAACYSDAGGY